MRAISAISRVLEHNNCSVKVFTTNVLDPTHPKSANPPLPHEKVDGVDVERLRPVICLAGYWVTLGLFWRLMRENYDILYAHCARSYQLDIATLVAFLRRKALIVTPHGSIYSYQSVRGWTRPLYLIHNAILKLVFRQASRIVATSQEEVRQIFRFVGSARKVVLIPNFVEESQFALLPERGTFRRRYGLDEKAKVLLFVGRLNKIKGIETLIKAFARIIASFDDLWLVLVGPDGGDLDNILDISRSMRCNEKVIITGALYGTNKLEAFVDSDLVVMPSLYESFGIVALEAYACGKPVVGSRVGGLQELVIPKYTGLQFEAGNESELCSILDYLLAKPDSLKEMGANGRDYVLKGFSDRAVGNRILAMCNELTAVRQVATK